MPSRRYRIGFVVEQALGHATHAANLQSVIPSDREIESVFALIPFEVSGVAARMPLFGSNWTVRAGLRARRHLAAMARAGRVDALFIHTQVPAVLAPDWLHRVPTVVSLDATPLQYDTLGAAYAHARGPAWLEGVKWRLNRRAFRSARHLVAWSDWARRGLAEGYGVDPGRVTVIPPGVRTRHWRRPAPRRDHGGPLRALFVGGDLNRKGGRLLVEAVRELRVDIRVELDLVTQSDLPAQPGVRVHNGLKANSAELVALFHAADVFCLPTEGDCLPLVLAEAAASGLPSVSSPIAAIPEIVRHEDTGLLVAPGNRGELIQALRRLAEDPEERGRMGARAAALAAADHDSERNARRLLRLLKQVADGAEGREAGLGSA